MTTDADFKVEDPFTGDRYITPSFEKVRAQGEQLALLSLRLLKDADVTTIERASIGLRATTIELPLDNTRFKLAAFLGILDHGLSGWMKLRSEIAAWKLDDMNTEFLQPPTMRGEPQLGLDLDTLRIKNLLNAYKKLT